jgi:serine protease Do
MIKNMKLGLAAVLVCMLLALSGMALYSGSFQMDGMLASAPATTSLAASNTSATTTTGTEAQNSTATGAMSAEASTQQVTGVLDATYAVEKVGPAVVTIVTTQNVTSPRGRFLGQATSVGSGVIIDSQGYIVTNYHVVEGQQSLEVIFSDGNKAPATLVGSDPSNDLAVLKVDTPVPAVAEFGNSDQLEQGQPAIAIGTALGDFSNTVTAGIVSALHRDLEDSGSTALRDLIQTDAAINEGNSGGPLIDLNGQVIGINVAAVRSTGMGGDVAEGLGFAIPSNTVREIAERLIGG